MKFIEIDAVPKKRAKQHKLQKFIEEFVNSDAKIVKIEIADTEYKSPKVCYSCLYAAVRRSGYAVKVHYRIGIVYMSKD